MGELSTTNDLITLREISGRASAEEVNHHLTNVLPRVRSWASEEMGSEEVLLEDLLGFRAQMAEVDKAIPSKVLLAATFVQQAIAINFFEAAAQESRKPGDRGYFRFMFELSSSMIATLEELSLAELEIAGKTEENITEELADPEMLPEAPDLATKAEYYLHHKEATRQFADLLIQDPTGRALIESHIEQVQNENSWRRHDIQEYHIAGAQFALEWYTRIYSLAEKIPNSNQ